MTAETVRQTVRQTIRKVKSLQLPTSSVRLLPSTLDVGYTFI